MTTLVSRLNLAKVEVEQTDPQQAADTLEELAREAEALGLRYPAAESSVYLAEALLRLQQAAAAQRVAEAGLRASERLGLLALQAKSHYLLGRAARSIGDEEGALGHYGQAARLLDAIRADSALRTRSVATISSASTRQSVLLPKILKRTVLRRERVRAHCEAVKPGTVPFRLQVVDVFALAIAAEKRAGV